MDQEGGKYFQVFLKFKLNLNMISSRISSNKEVAFPKDKKDFKTEIKINNPNQPFKINQTIISKEDREDSSIKTGNNKEEDNNSIEEDNKGIHNNNSNNSNSHHKNYIIMSNCNN